MKRARAAVALLIAIVCGSADVVAVGQPPDKPTFDFSDDVSRLRGERPKESDLLSDLTGAGRGAAPGATMPNAATLADEFNASLAKIRAQEDQLQAEAEARQFAEAEAARIAAIEAEQDRQAQLAASHAQGLQASCDRSYDRCESRCSGASNAALLGQFADTLSGSRTSSAPQPSYSSCASQCRGERTQCRASAEAGQGYRPTFKGPTGAASAGGGSQAYGQTAGSIDTPQCRAAEAEAKRAMSGLGRSSGICQPAKDSIAMYQAGLRYLQICPAADPTGEQRRMYESSLAQSRDVARASCN